MKSRNEFNSKEEYISYCKYCFAMAAMQGLLASMTESAAIGSWAIETKEKAEYAVKIADALLAELEKTEDAK